MEKKKIRLIARLDVKDVTGIIMSSVVPSITAI